MNILYSSTLNDAPQAGSDTPNIVLPGENTAFCDTCEFNNLLFSDPIYYMQSKHSEYMYQQHYSHNSYS